MNPRRKFNNTYTKYLQQAMIRRLRRAKVEFKLFCNSTLMELSKTNFKALMLLYDKALAAEKEEEERYNSEEI